ncbi:DUF4430 domain-containing protein [Adlercreutzia sp. ZJ304]|uniref:DUF4430 domain-containing protein n=1 Tax=Adlercreutzia sp. ZJ304 TaxID=2709791 RepID=UPI0013ECDF20|nr:DUF4430 domain-containing protein [Adlercreutzia sp. ZJ304]
MKQFKRFGICLVALVMSASMFLFGCASGAPSVEDMDQDTRNPVPESAVEAGEVVHVTVENPDGEEPIADTDVKIKDGMTALGALTELDIQVATVDSSYGPFVEMIDGISNEGSNGWTYSVNGEMPSVSAGEYAVSAGDKVTWTYYKA